MNFLKSDLTRNFALGFLIGVAVLFAQTGPELFGTAIPQAVAQTIQ